MQHLFIVLYHFVVKKKTNENTKAGTQKLAYDQLCKVYAITKRNDICTKTAKLWKSVCPQNAKVKKDVETKEVVKKSLW